MLSGSVAAARYSLAESILTLGGEPTTHVADCNRIITHAHDDDESTIDAREYQLRMRSAALHLELHRLQRAARDAPCEMFGGRFMSALHVTAFVLDLVGRINASLLRERALRASIVEWTWRGTYRVALANAEWAFGMIGRDPELCRLLAIGARADSDALRTSCQMIGLLIGAQVDPGECGAHAATICCGGLRTVKER